MNRKTKRIVTQLLAEDNDLGEEDLFHLLLSFQILDKQPANLEKLQLADIGDLQQIIHLSSDTLISKGFNESSVILLKLISRLLKEHHPDMKGFPMKQLHFADEIFFNDETKQNSHEEEIRTFANDEIDNVLKFLPLVNKFGSLEGFKSHLVENLPYNSESTRRRRTSYIVERFFPDGEIDNALAYFASVNANETALKHIIFYHLLKAEPLLRKIAEEFVWPALPSGFVEREDMREFILQYLPDIGSSSQKNILRSVLRSYELLDVGKVVNSRLVFKLHQGTMRAFIYILATECNTEGIYDFEVLLNGVMNKWLLWDREWIRTQLYKSRDKGIVSKVSEIDGMRQFTVPMSREDIIRQFIDESDI